MSKFYYTAVNVLILVISLFLLGFVESEKQESVEFKESPGVHESIAIPNMTLTHEIKAGIFLDGLRIDLSLIRPKDIARSIISWEHHIKRYSSQYGVDPNLVRAIIYAESKGDPYVISRTGAQGLMQIMPVTADFMGINNPFDPEQNIKAGVKYIAWLDDNDIIINEAHLLWAWNAGPSMISKNIIPGETKDFIIEVLSVKTFLKEDKGRTI